jgi:hypothetical protein
MPEAVAAKPELVSVNDEEPRKNPKEIVIELNTPVQAHGETIKKLTFRRPTGADLIAVGDDPIVFLGNRYKPNPSVMAEMMTILAAVPMSTIKQLESEDFVTCEWALVRFFVPGDQAFRF